MRAPECVRGRVLEPHQEIRLLEAKGRLTVLCFSHLIPECFGETGNRK